MSFFFAAQQLQSYVEYTLINPVLFPSLCETIEQLL